MPRFRTFGPLLAGILLAVGCGPTQPPTEPSAGPGDSSAGKTFVLGNLIESFTPPTLEELNQTAEWVDRPMRSGTEVLREQQRKLDPRPLSIEQALQLHNDSQTDNDKILASLGQLAPESGEGVDYDATWVRHVSGDLKSSNPVLISSITEFEYQMMTALNGGSLISYDKDINYFGPTEFIVSWQTSKDGLVDKIVLRDDLTWSDGKPITANDVKFTYRVIMSDAVLVPALRTPAMQMKWVEAYDDHTIVFFHKEPLATNTVNISMPILPKHVYEKSIADDPLMTRSAHHAELEDNPVVSGPYELVGRARNQEFVVRRRESFYMHNGRQVRPKPYFKEIRVKVIEDFNTALVALKAGQIEEEMLRAEQWVAQTDDEDFYARNTKVNAVEWTEFHFLWNLQSPFFSDRRVRQAMSWAMDYDELMKVVCHGLYRQSQGPYHPTSWMFPQDPPQPYHQDFVRAKALLEEAGWTDSDGDGIRDKLIDGQRVPFEFTMLTYQTETGVQAAVLLKTSLEQVGVICNVKPTEFTVLVDSTQKKQFEAAMGGWGSSTDPDGSSNTYMTGEARNYGSYSNPRVDELFREGRRELDHERRAAIYAEIHKILWEDQPYTYLFYRNAFYAFSKKLQGYNFAPTGPYLFDPGMYSIFKRAAAPN